MRWLSQLWTQIWITLVVAAVSLALYTSLGRQLVPLIESQQHDIEQTLTDAIGQPVRIGRLQGDWNILAPVVRMQDITLGDPASGFQIRRIEAELDVSATAFYQLPVFKRIEIDGVRGHIKQLGNKHWQLAEGWQVGRADDAFADNTPADTAPGSDNDDASQRPLWLRTLELQQAIVLLDWRLTHDGLDVDDQLEVRQLLWRNRGDSRAVEGQVAWGLEQLANVSVKGTLQGQLWPWDEQDGEFYVEVDTQEWGRWIPGSNDDAFRLTQLSAGLQGWGTIEDGDLSSLYGEIELPSMQLQTPGQPLTLTGGDITVRAQRQDQDWHMRITPIFHQALPMPEVSLSGILLNGRKAWQLGVPQLDLAATANLLQDHGLLPERYLKYIRNIQPRGDARNTRVSLIPATALSSGDEQPWRLAVNTRLDEVSSESYLGIPAFSDLSAELALTPEAGKLSVDDDEYGIFLKGIYAEPWRLEDGRGDFYWHIADDHFRLRVKHMQARFNGVPLTADVGLRLPREGSAVEPNTSVLMAFENAPASLRNDLVPELLDPAIRDWIDQSIVAGQFNNGVFVLNGRMGEDSPANSNQVQLYLDVSAGEIRYLPDWPAITGLNGRMLLDAPALDVWVDQGQTLGGRFVDHSARVRLRSNDRGDGSVLQVSGRLQGESAEALRYFTATPLQQVVDNAFDSWQADGPMDASMVMQLPLGDSDIQPDIKLDARFNNNRLTLGDLNITLEQLSGAISYNSDFGISAQQISGSVLGGDFRASIDSEPYSGGFDMLLSAEGDARWQQIKQWMPLFLLDPVDGTLNYNAALSLQSRQRGGIRFDVATDLQGTGIQMPQPMGKDPEQRRPLSLTVRPGSDTRIDMNYDGLVKSALALNKGTLDRGQIYIGGGDPFLPSDKGVLLRGKVDQEINAEQWWALWQRLTRVLEQQAADDDSQGGVGRDNDIAQKSDDGSRNKAVAKNPLTKIDLSIAAVDSWGIPMGPVSIDATQEWNEWDFLIDSALMKGLVTLKPGNEPIYMKLDYIHMPFADDTELSSDQPVADNRNQQSATAATTETATTAETAESAVTESDPLQDLNPADLPAIDLELAEFYLGSRNLGFWKGSSRPQANGMAIQLSDSNMKGMRFSGDILWLKQQGQHHTYLDTLEIRSKDVGKVLRSFRQKAVVESKDMRASLKLNWQGSPLNFNVASLNGLSSLRMKNGSCLVSKGYQLRYSQSQSQN